MDNLLDTKEAASKLGLDPRTLEAWRQRGSGPPFIRLSSRAVRYRQAALERFVEERERASTSADSPPSRAAL